MNFDEYKAIKEQEGEQSKPTSLESYLQEQTNPVVEPVEEPEVKEQPSETITDEGDTTPTITTPTEIEINGQMVSIDELKKGYVSSSEFESKQRNLMEQRNQVELQMQQIQQMQNPNQPINPYDAQFMQLQQQLADLQLQQEINEMKNRYNDFDVREVLNLAESTGITNLEQVYYLNKGMKPVESKQIDESEIEKRIRAQVMEELKQEKVGTQTLIGSTGGSIVQDTPETKLSPSQLKIAKGFGMSPTEYIKWLRK